MFGSSIFGHTFTGKRGEREREREREETQTHSLTPKEAIERYIMLCYDYNELRIGNGLTL
jgi:hypothetical protein